METGAKEPKGRDAKQCVSDIPSVVYVPRAGSTPKAELAALAAVYAFVLERHEHKRTATEALAETNATEVEGADKSGEVRLAKRGGGRHAGGG